MNNSVKLYKYLSKVTRRNQIEPEPVKHFRHVVCIPALAETDTIDKTIASLRQALSFTDSSVMVLVVVNNSISASIEDKNDNQLLLQNFRNNTGDISAGLLPGKELFWIDAASRGNEVLSSGGVGEARKIGFDAALPYLSQNNQSLLFSLDADTLVDKNYITAAEQCFAANPSLACAVFNFEHQLSGDVLIDSAIADYELYMRYYVMWLLLVGSPYGYYALGSAMVCQFDAYIRAGGMREKNGGEDFYFLQALRKIGMIDKIDATTVYPSSRASDRVPFGTGPKIRQILDGSNVAFHNPAIFLILGDFYKQSIINFHENNMLNLEANVSKNSCEEMRNFLNDNNFHNNWLAICKNHGKSQSQMYKALHQWFDAFKILKFVHYCERNVSHYPALNAVDGFKKLFSVADIAVDGKVFHSNKDLLKAVRTISIPNTENM